MLYAKTFDENFTFWGGAQWKAEKLGHDGLQALADHLEDVFSEDVPTETDINDYVWFELACAETSHGAPQCGSEYVFWCRYDDVPDEIAQEIEDGYARILFE